MHKQWIPGTLSFSSSPALTHIVVFPQSVATAIPLAVTTVISVELKCVPIGDVHVHISNHKKCEV